MKRTTRQLAFILIGIVAAFTVAIGLLTRWKPDQSPPNEKTVATAKPALTVSVTTPQPMTLPVRIAANGNIMPWQEASVGTEADGLRLAEVNVDVGDVVQRHQVLATFAADSVNAELAQRHAATAEAEAALAEAQANAQRARQLQTTGALSAQQINQYVTAERTAQARLEAARANEQTQQLRVTQTRVLAPDDGVISARSATLGAVLPAGQELFRLIRGRRLEWRAEVAASDLPRLQPGQLAQIRLTNDQVVEGRLRMIAPMVDTQTRNGLVYVDLPPDSPARAGMFARGEFDVGTDQAMTLPQSAVLLRDGFSYVLRVGKDAKVAQTKVTVGRRVGKHVEITGGISPEIPVVLAGGGFLGDGDLVRVVEELASSRDPVKPGEGPVVVTQQSSGGAQ
ncbi:efflux RND transporter periplasmic adaptor subunit [Stutzerimonas zhaodongensis]|uniref:Efflux RND transporter periplasmic adaptor subunit n=1 Tax=Stutzerimonas zhaodongensis TaxID=1176257 RepID=A0A3M2HRW6_9GAMM|nr:efflux RND transporter periplasmic adaptor subunit [Stutzerimonas zhaodongensis]MCQ4316269.1 efflux RND transporter periplasmic adaptor subunit [Stutzerimonas zhaodongensis]RMH89682.1 efflux RND transporter periplasmic adaptor subunit [Stutzerimonas zhaodongensis]